MNDEQAIEYIKSKLEIKDNKNYLMQMGRARRNYNKLKKRRFLPQKYIVLEWEKNIDEEKFLSLLNKEEI